jgi:ATP phosphoribosyltransferase regulatory subunit
MRLMLETLRVTGIDTVHLDLGHVGIYWNLAREAGLDASQEFTLFEMLQRKAAPEIEAYLQDIGLVGGIRDMLLTLTELNGGHEALTRARAVFKKARTRIGAALDYLDQAARRLSRLAPDIELHFDLAELRGYQYHTGVLFAAFGRGRGQEIARGGRYDEIGKVFGRARPATGFSTDLKTLIALGGEAEPLSQAAVFAPPTDDRALHERITELRAKGERVVCGLSGQEGESSAVASAMGCDRELVKRAGEWIVRTLD